MGFWTAGSGGCGPRGVHRVAYLFWAYFVVWLALAVYLLWLQRKIRAVAREVERLEEESWECASTGGRR